MNKYQEAKAWIDKINDHAEWTRCDIEEPALSQLKELVDRATPKKVIIEQYTPAYCPTCGEELSESLGDGYYKYYTHLDVCPNKECRQVLDWSDC